MKINIHIGGLAVLALASAVKAEPFVYREAEAGDLRSQRLTTLTVAAGANRVEGVTSFGLMEQEAPTFSGDRDPFALYVPRGVTVNSVVLTMLPLYGTIFGSEWLVVKDGDFGRPVADFSQSFEAYTQSWTVSLGAGTYLFHHAGLGGSFGSAWTHSWTFNATGQAAVVPEPPALLLLVIGLASVGMSKRSRAA